MNKTLRKRISSLTLALLTVAVGMVVAGFITLNRPLPEYLVAKSTLIPGERLGIESFEVKSLDLGSVGDTYLKVRNAPASFYLDEMLMAGELVPNQKVLMAPSLGLTTIVLSPSIPVSQKVTAGSWVQIWRTSPGAQGYMGELLVTRSQVVEVIQDSSFISEPGSNVEVLVSQSQAALLLETLASELNVYVLVAP
jgi:hypothetical protein